MATKTQYDILVYGSTSGAVASAIQSARLGHTVALVSPQAHIGGIQVEGLGATDIDNQQEFQNSGTVGGLSLELHQRISSYYGRKAQLDEAVAEKRKDALLWRFEAKVAETTIREWLAEHEIDIIFSSLANQGSVVKEDVNVRSITLENGQTISANLFIEGSYEGDLLAAAGITTVFGRESISTYGESLAGIRAETPYRQFDKVIDPYVVPGDPQSGTIFGVSEEPFGEPGANDKHLPAFSYRVPLTDVPNNQMAISKPDEYDPAWYELHRRWARAGGSFYLPLARLPGRKTDLIGSEGVLATDLVGMNDDWLTTDRRGREAIIKRTTAFTKGLLYFLTSDPCLPETVRTEWSRWGYCLDEFPDNDHFPRALYVRAGRRMVSDYIITQHTASVDGEAAVSDPVAIACWPTDTHCSRRVVRNGAVHNEGFIFKDGHRWRPFGISYKSLVPKKSEGTNVITATCPSASHVGYGAVRLEHQFYSLGQACANACHLAFRDSLAIQDVSYCELRALLLEQGVKLDADQIPLPLHNY